MNDESSIRTAIIAACNDMNAKGINQGTSGNISARFDSRMLITPSATPYHSMTADMIASIDLDGEADGNWDGPRKPSTEWRFHYYLLKNRPQVGAVVHAHPTYCTTLSILRKPIPACHYMVAAFGGNDVRCSGYATFGSKALADLAIEAMEDRTACLLANHGMITVGRTIDEAMWRAVELETLARQYHQSLLVGDPVILDDKEIDETIAMFAGYGLQED